MADAPPFPVLKTNRLELREMVAKDAPALFAIHGDAELMRWFGNDPLPDLAAAQNLVNAFSQLRLLSNPGIRWGIQLRGLPALIGTCGFFSWNRDWHKCSIGYELATQAQHQGYMREALSAALSWGFANMDLHRVEALIHPENVASLKLARGLGFVPEGRLRQVGRWGGVVHDMLQLSLLRHEWRPHSPEPNERSGVDAGCAGFLRIGPVWPGATHRECYSARGTFMEYRRATSDDAPLLARLNRELINDERHRNPMSVAELERRMAAWLAEEYAAVLFVRSGDPLGYALFRNEPGNVYLRQFFVCRSCRRTGVGRAALDWLRRNVWTESRRIRLDVWVGNVAAIEFWRSVGFSDYCLTMEMAADGAG